MTLSSVQFAIIARLRAIPYYKLYKHIPSFSKEITVDMCSEDFINMIGNIGIEAYRFIPREVVTSKIVMRGLSGHDAIYDEIKYFNHLLGDAELVNHLINHYQDAISCIPATYLTEKHYNLVIERELSSDQTDSYCLKYIPEKYLSNENKTYILANDANPWNDEVLNLFNLNMLPYFVINASPVLVSMPDFMCNALTKDDLKKIIDKDVLLATKIKTRLFDEETIKYSLDSIGKDNRGFKNIYEMIENKTPALIVSLYNKGFYSTVLFDDLIAADIEFNPVKLYHVSLMSGSKQYCIKRILKHFSSKEIGQFFLSYKSAMAQKEIKQAIKDLLIDYALE